MKGILRIGLALAMTSLAMCFPMSTKHAAAAETHATQKLALDVVLFGDGILRGEVVNGQGQPIPGAQVVLRPSVKVSQEAVANDKGEFQLRGLKPGVHGIIVRTQNGSTQRIVRLWLKETAPPLATPLAVLTVDQTVVPVQLTELPNVPTTNEPPRLPEELPIVVPSHPSPPPPDEDSLRRRRRLLGWLLVGGAGGGIIAGIATSAGNGQSQPVAPPLASP